MPFFRNTYMIQINNAEIILRFILDFSAEHVERCQAWLLDRDGRSKLEDVPRISSNRKNKKKKLNVITTSGRDEHKPIEGVNQKLGWCLSWHLNSKIRVHINGLTFNHIVSKFCERTKETHRALNYHILWK